LLPGVLMRNASLKFVCKDVWLKVEQNDTLFTNRFRKGEVMRLPIAHGDGNYFADAGTLDALEAEGRVVLRYADRAGNATPEANPNGAQRNIAGICDGRRRVLGMMPHPERLIEPVLGGVDGRRLFESIVASLVA
jgi:phosphoribosylformylglycinamidine synthase